MSLLCVGCVSLSMSHASILYRSCLSLNEVDHRSTWDIYFLYLYLYAGKQKEMTALNPYFRLVPWSPVWYLFRMHSCTHKLDDYGIHTNMSELVRRTLSVPGGQQAWLWSIYMSRVSISFSHVSFLHVNHVSYMSIMYLLYVSRVSFFLSHVSSR